MSGRLLSRAQPGLSNEVGPWLYVLALLCLISLVAFLYLAQTTSVAKQAEEMETLEKKLRQLKWDGNALLLEIAQHQHISRIQQEARAMGLGEAEHVEYVEVLLDQPRMPPGGDIRQNSPSSLRKALSRFPAWLDDVLRQFGGWASEGAVRAE